MYNFERSRQVDIITFINTCISTQMDISVTLRYKCTSIRPSPLLQVHYQLADLPRFRARERLLRHR